LLENTPRFWVKNGKFAKVIGNIREHQKAIEAKGGRKYNPYD
jgi:hypothetical protein